MVNVQNAVRRAENKLPEEVKRSGINVSTRSSDMLSVFSFMTDGSVMSPMELNNYVNTTVVDALSRVDGVALISVMSSREYAMRIWLDSFRMAGMGISTDDVANAIKGQNVQAAAGSIGSEIGPRISRHHGRHP